jgi:hypothetical protein
MMMMNKKKVEINDEKKQIVQSDRQTDRQTDRKKEREREKEDKVNYR